MEPIDVEINVRMLKGRPDWLVEVRSLEPTIVVPVSPLADEDLEALPDLHRDARSWKGFFESLSPGGSYTPGAATLRAVGGLVRDRVLGSAEIVSHLKSIEPSASGGRSASSLRSMKTSPVSRSSPWSFLMMETGSSSNRRTGRRFAARREATPATSGSVPDREPFSSPPRTAETRIPRFSRTTSVPLRKRSAEPASSPE